MRPSGSLIIIIISALVIAVNFGFGQTVLKKKDFELSSVEEEIRGLRDVVRRGRSDATQDIALFKKKLPSGAGLTSALEEVFQAAKRNGLKMPAGDYSPETIKDMDISRYTIDLPVEGSYSRIKRFVYDLENSRHYITVEELSLSSSKGKEGMIGLKIRLSVYFI